MLIMEIRHESSLITYLRSFYETLSGPDIKKSLHFEIVVLNSSFKKSFYSIISLDWILFKM